MSIEVATDSLTDAVKAFAVAYLLTLGDRPNPHVGAVTTTVEDGVVRVGDVGRTALRDVVGHDTVTLLWAPSSAGEYSLIVDGVATVVGDQLDVVPLRSVLHRPAAHARPTEAGCAADCVELPAERPRRARAPELLREPTPLDSDQP